MTEPQYHINLFWSDEDGLWIAEVPDLRGCVTHGETRNEAVNHAAEAIEGWLETTPDAGMEIPTPQYRPPSHAARDAA